VNYLVARLSKREFKVALVDNADCFVVPAKSIEFSDVRVGILMFARIFDDPNICGEFD